MRSQKKQIIGLGFLILSVLLLILAACSANPATIETVEETVEEVDVVKEVEATKDVEVIKEVEIEEIIEIEPELAEESAEEDTSMGDSQGGIEATGSEEDEGSPYTPTKNKVGKEQQVAQNIGWIQASGVITDPLTVRLLASRTDDVVVVMTVTTDGQQQELIITNQIQRFRQSSVPNQPSNQIYLTTTSADWQSLIEPINQILTTNVANGLNCDFCAVGESGERYTLIAENQLLTFELDAGESIEELDPFLVKMRTLMAQSGQYAQNIWSRAE